LYLSQDSLANSLKTSIIAISQSAKPTYFGLPFYPGPMYTPFLALSGLRSPNLAEHAR